MGYILLLIGIIILDQSTKFYAEKLYMLNYSLTDIHSYFHGAQPVFHLGSSNWLDLSLTYTRNTGAAWGLLGNLPENIRPYFFYVLTSIVMLFILVFFIKTKKHQKLVKIATLLIFAGALGNFVDRVYLHYVIDWIRVQWSIWGWYYDYPVFNVADSAIVVGVILLVIDTLIGEGNGTAVSKELDTSSK